MYNVFLVMMAPVFMGLIVMHNEQWAMVLLCVLIVADFLIITGKIKNIFKGV